jgi:hypothetical protein
LIWAFDHNSLQTTFACLGLLYRSGLVQRIAVAPVFLRLIRPFSICIGRMIAMFFCVKQGGGRRWAVGPIKDDNAVWRKKGERGSIKPD